MDWFAHYCVITFQFNGSRVGCPCHILRSLRRRASFTLNPCIIAAGIDNNLVEYPEILHYWWHVYIMFSSVITAAPHPLQATWPAVHEKDRGVIIPPVYCFRDHRRKASTLMEMLERIEAPCINIERHVAATQSVIFDNPDSKVHGANMGPIWGRQDSGGPHVGPMSFAIWEPPPCPSTPPQRLISPEWKALTSYQLITHFFDKIVPHIPNVNHANVFCIKHCECWKKFPAFILSNPE